MTFKIDTPYLKSESNDKKKTTRIDKDKPVNSELFVLPKVIGW